MPGVQLSAATASPVTVAGLVAGSFAELTPTIGGGITAQVSVAPPDTGATWNGALHFYYTPDGINLYQYPDASVCYANNTTGAPASGIYGTYTVQAASVKFYAVLTALANGSIIVDIGEGIALAAPGQVPGNGSGGGGTATNVTVTAVSNGVVVTTTPEGQYNTSLPVLSNGQTSAVLQLDGNGVPYVDPLSLNYTTDSIALSPPVTLILGPHAQQAVYNNSNQPTYIGYAPINTPVSAAGWYIEHFVYDGSGNLLNITWATVSGTTATWSGCAGYTYN